MKWNETEWQVSWNSWEMHFFGKCLAFADYKMSNGTNIFQGFQLVIFQKKMSLSDVTSLSSSPYNATNSLVRGRKKQQMQLQYQVPVKFCRLLTDLSFSIHLKIGHLSLVRFVCLHKDAKQCCDSTNFNCTFCTGCWPAQWVQSSLVASLHF